MKKFSVLALGVVVGLCVVSGLDAAVQYGPKRPLFGRSIATVYQNAGYRGESLAVDRDIPDLAALRATGSVNGRGRGNGKNFRNWNHQISSLQVQPRRLYR